MTGFVSAVFAFLALFVIPSAAQAHEAYVLSPDAFARGLAEERFNILSVLRDPAALKLFLIISLAVALAIVCAGVLRRTSSAARARAALLKFSGTGRIILRASTGLALIAAGFSGSLFGPEMSLADLSLGNFIAPILIGAGILLAIGFLTEIAAAAGILLFVLVLFQYGGYAWSYSAWLGAFLILGFAKRFPKVSEYEPAILRICFGFGLVYAAIAIKILHPLLTLTVIEQYHLTSIPFLFPSDPFLALLGAALAELALGLFILFGFELRAALIVSVFYMTGAYFVFREPLWPHFILYGAVIYLFLAPEKFAVDNWLDKNRQL